MNNVNYEFINEVLERNVSVIYGLFSGLCFSLTDEDFYEILEKYEEIIDKINYYTINNPNFIFTEEEDLLNIFDLIESIMIKITY